MLRTTFLSGRKRKWTFSANFTETFGQFAGHVKNLYSSQLNFVVNACSERREWQFGCENFPGAYAPRPSGNQFFSGKIAIAVPKFSSPIRLWSGKCHQTGWTPLLKDASYAPEYNNHKSRGKCFKTDKFTTVNLINCPLVDTLLGCMLWRYVQRTYSQSCLDFHRHYTCHCYVPRKSEFYGGSYVLIGTQEREKMLQ